MSFSRRSLGFLLTILSFVVPASAQVNYTMTGTLTKISGTDPLALDGNTVTLNATLAQSGSPTTGASSSSLTLTGQTAVTFSNGVLTRTCASPGATMVLADNVAGPDNLSIQNCLLTLFATGGAVIGGVRADATLPNQVMVTALPASFPSTSISGTAYFSDLNNVLTTYSLTGTAVASGSAPPTVTPSISSWSPTVQGPSSTSVQQTVTFSASAPVSFSTSTSGGSWLTVSPSAQNTTTSLTITANPTGLSAGTYNGTVTMTERTGLTFSIPVTLTVNGAAATISASPSTLTFNYQIGGATPATQNISIGGTAGVAYTLSKNQTWLGVTGNGNTPGTGVVSVDPTGLTAGTYNGTVTVTAAGASNSPQTVAVTLNVTAAPTISASPSTLTFNYQIGGSAPSAQNFTIGGTSGVAYTLSKNQTWLGVTGNGNTPGTGTVTVDTTGLTAGTYNGTVTVTAAGASNSPQTVAVTLNVTPAPTISASPSTLTFNYQIGSATPASQGITIGGTAGVSYTLSKNQTWLGVTGNGTTPGTGTVSVDPTGLTAGTYNGTVTVTAAGASNSPQTVAVTLNVTPAPTISASPSTLTFNYQIGSATPASQSITIGGTAGLSYTLSKDQTWLGVTGNGTSPGTGTVTVDPTGLTAGTYTGTISVTAAGASNSPQTVSVTLNVTPAPTLTSSQPSLSFTYQIGGTNPASQGLVVSGTAGLTFTAAAAGGSWLSVTPTGGTTPTDISVSANPTGLAAGTYNGTVTLSASGVTPVVVNVSLLVSAAPTISATPGTLTFNYQLGGSVPAAQNITIGGSTGLAFTLSKNQSWLNVTGNGNTPGTGVVTVDPTGLTAGTYNGTITVTAAGASNSPQSVAVTLNVTAAPTISASPSTLSFSYQIGGSVPAAQSLTIGGTSGLSYTLSKNQSWLNVTGNGATPGSGSVTVDPTGLSAGTYNGTITVTAAGASNSPQTVAVSLTVTAAATTISASPSSLSFNYQVGGTAPAAQTITIGGSAGVAYTLSKNQSWINVTGNGNTPGFGTVTIDPTGLTPGTYNGTVTVSAPSATNSPQTVAVTLTVTPAPVTISASPSTLSFNYQIGGTAPAAQTITIGGSAGVSYVLSKNQTWINVTGNGSTPGTGTVTVDPTGLAAGTYSGTVTVTAAGATNSPQTVAVTLTVTAAPTLTVSPGSLSFSYQLGNTAPSGQTLNVGGTAGAFTAVAAGGSWLSVSASGGTAPGTITVTVNPAGLAANTYNGTVTLSAAGVTPVVVNVSFLVSSAPTISATPGALSFSYQLGGTAPASQTLSLGGSAGLAYTLTSNAAWLTVTVNGTTPGTATVSVNTTGLAAGTYNGTITVTSAGASNSPQTVTVQLVVSESPAPVVSAVQNLLTTDSDGFAPGSLIMITGTKLGPEQSVAFSVNAQGKLDPTLAGVKVTVNGTAAIPLMVWKNQINAILPFTLPTTGRVTVEVEYNGNKSASLTIPMAPSAPRLFTLDGNPTGPLAALNQDGTVNSATNPAAAGSYVSLFGGGAGLMNPAGTAGDVAPRTTLSFVSQVVTGTASGTSVDLSYSGSAPTLIYGVYQFNVKLPTGVSGAIQIRLKVGDNQSQQGVTVFVR